MESMWHAHSGMLLKAGYVTARAERRDFFVGINTFFYYSIHQVRNNDFIGPDVYFVNGVDGSRKRRYWATWDEDGRYPDVIIELLSDSTERTDLTTKKDLYATRFRTPEYFCIGYEVGRLLGWRLGSGLVYEPIVPDADGRLWSEQLQLSIGPWQGSFLTETYTWARFYDQDGALVPTPDEAATERAEAATARADDLAARLAEVEAQLAALRRS